MPAIPAPPPSQPLPVLIAGGGPVGLSLAALLGAHGVRSLVVEADDGYCEGSRAICISRRSLEILGWVGADRPLVEKGLSWVGGRSHFRHDEVLHFRMPSEPGERFPPMVNIQQYYIEQFAHQAMQRHPEHCLLRRSTRVAAVRPAAHAVEVDIESAAGVRETLRAAWLVACDGGRSTVREQLGLAFTGMQYEGRYVIVDIEQSTGREVERLAWFDPPSNPGSTILMHRQPDNVWRIDYQLRDDEDPAEAVKPENVLPRVQSHLEMIGETAPWKPLWISIYNAKCLTLERYRHGRVLFAGDAAHLVPIFGVRGLNSGLDDAANLAWKLALVLNEGADAALLDSYSDERVHATRENLAYGAKSTEFMAPPHFGFELMRQAALRLAIEDDAVRALINPRQSTPVRYVGSPLNLEPDDEVFHGGPQAGDVAPDASVHGTGFNGGAGGADHGANDAANDSGKNSGKNSGTGGHLSQRFGRTFVALHFSEHPGPPEPLKALGRGGATAVEVLRITRSGLVEPHTLVDHLGEAWQRYDAREGTLYLIRPDAYVLGRWRDPDCSAISAALARYGRAA
jgi:3-(3-hydroxy-phenyl)propionate hydroxylase